MPRKGFATMKHLVGSERSMVIHEINEFLPNRSLAGADFISMWMRHMGRSGHPRARSVNEFKS